MSYNQWLILSEDSERTFNEEDYVFMEDIIISKETVDELRTVYGLTDKEILEMIEDTINGEPRGPFKDWEWHEEK